jgi:predicted NBD/HSP70 family sugar kinase
LAQVAEITAQEVGRAARDGDAVSQQLLADAGRHVGSALASLVNLLNPGLVLIGGGVVEAGEFVLDPIRQAVRERSMRASLHATRLEKAQLGERATARGAVALALTRTFERFGERDTRRAAPARLAQPVLLG